MVDRILIVDDEKPIRRFLAASLRDRGYETKAVGEGRIALEEIKTPYNLVIADIRLPDFDGIELLERIKRLSPLTEVILATGYASVDTAIRAIECGAFAYLTKPIREDALFHTVERAIEKQKLVVENQRLLANLKKSNTRLANLAKTLEKRVEERTCELLRSEEETKKKAQELAIINEITNAITSSIYLSEVFKIVVKETRKIVGFDRASVSLSNGSDKINKVYFLAPTEREVPETGKTYPLKGTGIEWVIKNKKPLIRGDLTTAGDFIEDDYLQETGAKSGIVIPLIYRGESIGTFNLGSKKKNAYTTEHENILRQIAGQIAIALKNAELHKELKKYSATLEVKVAERTKALQENLRQLKQAQEKLIQSEKLAATSKLIAGVAHEVKNPLNSMSFSTANIEKILYGQADLETVREFCKESLEILRSDIERLKNLVNRFMSFAKPIQINLEDGDVNDIIGKIVKSIRGELTEKNITIIESYDKRISLLKLERDEFHRSILNLILNSIDAVKPGGRIEIKTVLLDGTVLIEVTDNGCGIPPEIQDKIFDIFFTTKTKGAGLGLSQIYRTVESHRGSINFHSETGKGTTFQINLPIN